MFLTTPSRIWPSASVASSSLRCSARLSSSTARRLTTMLPRRRSILRIRNGSVLLISGPMSRTGRMSTWLPGRKATAPPRSTAKPPLTRPKMWPSTLLVSVKARSSRFQLSSRLAFSRLRTTSPPLFSNRSTNTSTLSPTRTSGGWPGEPNSLSGTRPSDLRPTSTMTMSSSSPTTVPRTTLPSRRVPVLSVSSSIAAKSSSEGRGSMVWVASCIPAPERCRHAGRRAPPGQRAGVGVAHANVWFSRRGVRPWQARLRCDRGPRRRRPAHRARSCRAPKRREQYASARPPCPHRGDHAVAALPKPPRI